MYTQCQGKSFLVLIELMVDNVVCHVVQHVTDETQRTENKRTIKWRRNEMGEIKTAREFLKALKSKQPVAGYTNFFVSVYGVAMCEDCAEEKKAEIVHSIVHSVKDEYRITSIDNDMNFEDYLTCGECGDTICEGEEDLTSNDVFEIVHESYINGQLKQAVEQLNSAGESLPDFIEYVRDVSGTNEALDIALRLLKVRA